MTPTPRIARNIDEVLSQLEDIIHHAETTGDRAGYFAALYHKVTLKVKEGITEGLFENGERLAELDVLFANRYLYALGEWRKDRNSVAVSQSWKKAFENHGNKSRLVLQHLLLGMNAHINYDLAIAVVELANAGNDINAIRRDYNAINLILSSLTYSVIRNLNTISPFLSFLGFTGTKSNSMLVQFSMGNARDGSWCFATDLAAKTGNDADIFIQNRDKEITDLGNMLVTSWGFLKMGIWLIRLFEWKKVGRIIDMLHTHQKMSMKELK